MYETAYSIYQNHVAAVALAHGEDEGVAQELVEKTAKALEHLRQARRQYRDALLSAAFS